MKHTNIKKCRSFRMARLFSVVYILLISTVCMAEQQQVAGRSYEIYKPARADTKGLPLMIVLHGGLGNANGMEQNTGMNEVADKGQFVVAYPEGTGGRLFFMKDKRTWNAGDCCGVAVKDRVDDVGFIRKMINDIENKYAVDSTRIYVVGHSNGAMMAYRLACEIPDKIAAIVSVSGTLTIDHCEGANGVAILEIHGAKDDNVPLGGGKGKGPSGVIYRSVADSLAIMMKTRQCRLATQASSMGVEKTVYSCERGAPVSLEVLANGTHPWPGGNGSRSNEADGFSASDAAWQFAKNFSKARR